MQTQAYDIALAKQIKANDPNARFLLDFHYSDTWADPGHQSLPSGSGRAIAGGASKARSNRIRKTRSWPSKAPA